MRGKPDDWAKAHPRLPTSGEVAISSAELMKARRRFTEAGIPEYLAGAARRMLWTFIVSQRLKATSSIDEIAGKDILRCAAFRVSWLWQHLPTG